MYQPQVGWAVCIAMSIACAFSVAQAEDGSSSNPGASLGSKLLQSGSQTVAQLPSKKQAEKSLATDAGTYTQIVADQIARIPKSPPELTRPGEP